MTYVDGKALVPEISDERLNDLILKIVPVIRRDNVLHKIVLPNLKTTAYTWNPEIAEEYDNLEEVARIKTHHYCGHPTFFKPSISEVLAQIPEELIDIVVAFEIIQDAEPPSENEIKVFQYGNGHLATTILYKKGETL